MRLTTDAVAAADLVLAYDGKVALARSTFTVPTGQVTVMIGPNGSGKSTLLNAVAGLIRPASGDLQVAAGPGPNPRIAYVPQSTGLNESLPVSVAEVVTMGRYAGLGPYRRLREEDRAAVAEAMSRTGLAALARRQLHELSAGQRQRVFIAQGLAQDHDLLLLDEPLTGVDLTTAQAIDDIIHEETDRGCTVVLSSHDLSEALVADHVLLLSGRVVAHGPPDEVLTPAHLTEAYGPAILHVAEGRLFIDDPAHVPVPGRHSHQDRTIHTESSPSDRHQEREWPG